MATTRIPIGTELFHGTSSLEDFDIPEGPAWFGNTFSVAKNFAIFAKGKGLPRVIRFRVIKNISKLEMILNKEDWSRFQDKIERKISEEASPDIREFAQQVCSAWMNGWVIPYNYPDGGDILICDPPQWLEATDVKAIDRPT